MSSPHVGLRAFAGLSLLVRLGIACAAPVLVLATATPALAQNKFWVTAAGGAFGTAANWSTSAGGAGGATPPAAGELAIFTLGGPYTVSFGANVDNAGVNVSNGTVTLDLNSFNYTITGGVGTVVGTVTTQTGRLIVKDGILGVDTFGDDIAIGAVVGATGTLTVSTGGKLGNGVLDPDIVVGTVGTGTLGIEDNGRVDVAQLNIGQGEGSTGTVSLTTPNSILDASAAVIVGLSGTGTLNVQSSSTLNTASSVIIGNLLGGKGNMTVTGSGTNWTGAGALIVGDAGDAGLSVQSTAQVNTTGAVTIGNAATGTGAAIVTGADTVWNMSNGLTLGINGTGNMAATAGGRINTTGLTVMSLNAGSDSAVVVTGAGSRWTSGTLTVANLGTAAIQISAGGQVNTTGNVLFATSAAGNGKATISGAGSAWNINGAMTIASVGAGTLTVESGGSLTTTGQLSLVDPAGLPNGTLNFQGGTISATGFFRSAGATLNWTDGTFIVNGGALNNSGAALTINGADTDDLPALRLASGATSSIANLPNVTVGSNRQGALIVSGGSNFPTTTTSIGALDGGSGSLLVEGVNSTFGTTGDLNVAGTNTTGGGIGVLTLGTSGSVFVGGQLRLWNGAIVNMNGGTLTFNTMGTNGGRFNFVSGTVQVSTNFSANSLILDALLGPTHVLGPGRRIDALTNQFSVQSDLNVEGGTVAGGTLVISPGFSALISSGGRAMFASGITNNAGARLFVTDADLSGGTSLTNNGELMLAGTTATVSATSITNTGLIAGAGRINNVVTNSTAGQIRVGAGERLQILGAAGSSTNDGLIDVDGGTIEFGRSITNSTVSPSTGMIAARDATLHFLGGLVNSGALTFTDGVSDVFGDVTTTSTAATPGRTGRIVVTGGAQANFFDDVVNNGSIQVSAVGGVQSRAVFLGSLSGNGTTGTGPVFIEGDMRPGFSPGTMAFGGDVSYSPLATLEIELAGTAPGTQYDRVTVAGNVALAGALEVSLLGGFKPAAGNSFAILTAGGSITGTFGNEILPQLAGGLQWDLSYLPQSVSLNVGGVLGDYNLNGTVDSADYVVWRNLLNSNTPVADGSGNGIVDQADYDVWRAHFGDVAAPSAGSLVGSPTVPEPATLALAGCSAALALLTRRKRS